MQFFFQKLGTNTFWEQKYFLLSSRFFFVYYINYNLRLQYIRKNVFKCDMYLFKETIKVKKMKFS